MRSARKLYINGKFLVQRTTGVQRFARGMVGALDKLLVHQADISPPVLLTPPGATPLALEVIEQQTCGSAGLGATLWEQSVLPWAARDGVLLCLAGSAPLFGGTRIPTIHDAAIYLHPEAYSWRFIAWYRLLFARVSRAAPVIFTVSANAARELAQQLPGRQFRVVPNAAEHMMSQAADSTILQKRQLAPGRYLLAVASQNPTKNLDTLIAAYRATGLGPDIALVLVGGANSSVFAAGGGDASLPGLLHAGTVSDAALRALYENAAAFVFPSLYEGFGIPPLEAMSCGCPVLASNASSIPEVCGDAALYFDPRDPQAMAMAMRTLMAQPVLREALVAKGRERQAQFSWSHSARTMLAHLQAQGLLLPLPVSAARPAL